MEEQRPGGRLTRGTEQSVTQSQWLPLLSQSPHLVQKANLLPIAVTILTGSLLVYAADNRPAAFIPILACFLSLAPAYVIYRVAGKPIPMLALAASTVFTALLLSSILFIPMVGGFYMRLVGWAEPNGASILPVRFLGFIFRVGIPEETIKAIPVLLGAWIWFKAASPLRERVGVREPLDGILYAVFSATGFALVETMGSYIYPVLLKATKLGSDISSQSADPNAKKFLQDLADQAGQFNAIQELLIRGFHSISGHLAYSGVLGYYIGLAVLKPKHAPRLILTGFCIAISLHAFWDALGNSVIVSTLTGLVAYAVLGSVILKARQISPTRDRNFAKSGNSVAGTMLSVAPAEAAVNDAGPADRPVTNYADSGPMLHVGQLALPMRDGARLYASQVDGLIPLKGDGVVALVNRNPQDPSMLGLQNLSRADWTWERPGKEARTIPPERSLHLVSGCRIHFGCVDGEVR